jgi:hypothetical protein
MLRPTVNWPVCLGIKHLSWTRSLLLSDSYRLVDVGRSDERTVLSFARVTVSSNKSVVSTSHIATDGQSGAHDQIFTSITVWQLRSCFCGAPSLTRGRVCLLCMLLALASEVFLGSVFYCLRFETSLFVPAYDSQGHGGGIRPRLHTGLLSAQTRPVAWYSLGADHI